MNAMSGEPVLMIQTVTDAKPWTESADMTYFMIAQCK